MWIILLNQIYIFLLSIFKKKKKRLHWVVGESETPGPCLNANDYDLECATQVHKNKKIKKID